MQVAVKINTTERAGREHSEQDGVCSGDKHHHEGRCADQCGRAEIDLGDNERDQQPDGDERYYEAENQVAGPAFKTREPPRQKKYCGDLGDFRWLKCDRTGADPAARAVDAQSKVRHEAESQGSEREKEPHPPGAIPEMVINQRGRNQNGKANPEPERLAFDKEVNVAVSIARECAGAEKHDHPDDEHRQHRQK